MPSSFAIYGDSASQLLGVRPQPEVQEASGFQRPENNIGVFPFVAFMVALLLVRFVYEIAEEVE